MKKALLIVLFACIKITNAQIITTIAGNGTGGYSGDGGQATAAQLYHPYGVSFDAAGNLYIADNVYSIIRKINSAGTITTIAGNGTGGYSGDGGQATAAELYNPVTAVFDAAGNIYIAEYSNNLIRMVNTLGIISTIAGNGTAGYGGDGGQATAATLYQANSVCVDVSGNIYIADRANNRIRMVTTAGIINTYAGNGSGGYSGDGGPATAAMLDSPWEVITDASGNLYIADSNNRIRKVTTAGIISTIAGNGTAGYSGDGGQATAAELNGPTGISMDVTGNLYIAEYGNSRIRMVNNAGIITTIAGNGTAGYSNDGGPALMAELNGPGGIAIDAVGKTLYISDSQNNAVRAVCLNTDSVTGFVKDTLGNLVTAGIVYAFKRQLLHPGLFDTLGYVNLGANGYYGFSNVIGNNYIIQAIADTSIAAYHSAVSTYYSSTNSLYRYRWDSATVVYNNPCIITNSTGNNINLIQLHAQTGTGKISGNVTAAAGYGQRLAGSYNNTMGSVKSVDVKLGKKPTGGCTNRTSTDAAGNYSFTGIDTGTYVVYVDIPNFTDTLVNLTISLTNSVYTNINYCVDSVMIHFCSNYTTGTKQVAGINEEVMVYPNPTSSSIQVTLSGNSENTNIEIYNIIGECVHRQIATSPNCQINLADLSNGMYQLRVLKNNNTVYQTKVVKQD